MKHWSTNDRNLLHQLRELVKPKDLTALSMIGYLTTNTIEITTQEGRLYHLSMKDASFGQFYNMNDLQESYALDIGPEFVNRLTELLEKAEGGEVRLFYYGKKVDVVDTRPS